MREEAKADLRRAVGLLVVGFTVVMGVASFTAESSPTTPSVHLVRVLPTGPNGVPLARFVVTASFDSVQPPNGIDLLPPKLVVSAWEGRTILTLDQPSALAFLSGTGPLYECSATVDIPLVNGTTDGRNLTVEVQAQVPTYDGTVYYSPWATWTANGTTGGPAPDGTELYVFNAVGPWVASAAAGIAGTYAVRRLRG